MAQRNRLGLFYSYNEYWIGGTYYIENLIAACSLLAEDEKPQIVIYTFNQNDFKRLVNITGYPYLEVHILNENQKLNKLEKICNRIALKVFKKKNFIIKKVKADVAIFYPSPNAFIDSSHLRQIYWIPDFQEYFLPELFSKEELKRRAASHSKALKNADLIVLSSEAAKEDFKSIFSHYKGQIKVVPFAVIHPSLEDFNRETIFDKYSIDRDYFFAPNQFWSHKNHELIIKAVAKLVEKKPDILVLFSGKEEDYRGTKHIDALKKAVVDKGLSNHIRFLGFLPRGEQLVILKNAKAIIQPSKFEGWSTVVEDAKAQNKFLLLSDIKVHREQVSEGALFFDVDDDETLVSYMTMAKEIYDIDSYKRKGYEESLLDFAHNVNSLFEL